MEEKKCLRVLCPKIVTSKEPGLQWLIGSPFFTPFTIISSFRCLHTQPNDPFAPDYNAEADDLRALLVRGFDIIGAVFVNSVNQEENAIRAVEVSHRMKNSLVQDEVDDDMIGAVADLSSNEIQFFISKSGKSLNLEKFGNVIYDDNPEKYIWETGCLLRSEMMIQLPIYFPINRPTDADGLFSSVVSAAAAKLRNPQVAYMVEGADVPSEEGPCPIILRGTELDFSSEISDFKCSKCTDIKSASNLPCSYFSSKSKMLSGSTARETADAIQVTALANQLRNCTKITAPIAEFFPASEPARLLVISFKLDVLCYVSKDLSVASAISKLIIPGLIDQLTTMKKATAPFLFSQLPQLCPYHFFPPGILHPITAIYELLYGETEMKQAEVRKLLHLRLGLPVDRPLLRVANSLSFIHTKGTARSKQIRNGSVCLRDVHAGLLGSGVSGGVVSQVQGSYEYHHYLQDGFDDNGWGCAYRSLQTIISWFKLQHYTSVEVPSHREIQQALVDIGDKEVSFIGSCEWIGAVELSFVLDKLLGVSCKIINVRSGTELPEKCRELALHFETQGTPIMIGGGVLAYTLLGVDYNEVTGECAFLILDPHYTGGDELKRIMNGGWCGWKKAIDKDRSFFLHDKFYNLLLPQRPNMV